MASFGFAIFTMLVRFDARSFLLCSMSHPNCPRRALILSSRLSAVLELNMPDARSVHPVPYHALSAIMHL